MKKILFIILGFLLVLAVVFQFYQYERTDFMLDTTITIKAKGVMSKKAVDEAFKEIKRIEKLLSAYIENSQIAKINENGSLDVDDETKNILNDALEYSKKTDGAFDISIKPLVDLWNIKNMTTPPKQSDIDETLKVVGYKNIEIKKNTVTLKKQGSAIDLGGIAKGYCADCAAKILKKYRVTQAVLDLGGNVYVMGNKSFKIGLQNPNSPRGEYFGIYTGNNTSVVTSGAYERNVTINGKMYHHIINPHDGQCADSGVISATVMGKNSKKCDAFATAIYVLGVKNGLNVINKEKDLECIIVDKNNKVYVSNDANFTITDKNFERGN